MARPAPKRERGRTAEPDRASEIVPERSPIRICCEAWRSESDWLLLYLHRARVASRPDLFGGDK